MRFVRNIVALLALTIWLQQASAQVGLSAEAVSAPTTLSVGQSTTFNLLIKNTDTAAFFGNLYFNYSINDSVYTTSDLVSGLQYDTIFSLLLLSGDTAIRTITVHASPPKFQTGPSVVVIWPIALLSGNTTAFARDSAKFTINIADTATAITEALNNTLLYYSGHQIWLKNDDGIGLNRVRIYDATGHLIYNANAANKSRFPVPDLPTGMYIAEAVLSNNATVHLKFIETPH